MIKRNNAPRLVLLLLLILLLVRCGPAKTTAVSEAEQEATQETAQEATQEAAQEATQEAAQEAAQEATQEAAQEATQEAAQEATQEAAQEVMPESPKYFFEPELSANDLFGMGNEAYKSTDYEKAEACYNCAIERVEQVDSSTEETLFHVKNNLILTLLQLEKNKEAWELSSELVALEAPEDTDHFGCILNHLVCAKAVGRSAAETLNVLVDEGLYDGFDLEELAEDEPGDYMKLALGIAYNALYIDMEDEAVDRILGMSSDVGYYYPVLPFERDYIYNSISENTEDRKAVLWDVLYVLGHLQDQNVETFGEEDPDITALIEYTDALLETKSEE